MAKSTTIETAGADRWTHALGALVIASIGVLYWYRDVAASLVDDWLRYGTYTHGILIVPISLWLVWQKRSALLPLEPKPAWAPFVILLGGALLMTAATLIGVKVVQQFTLVALIATSVWIVLGHRVAWSILFPLLFMFAAVPMGRDLVPPMMDFTATFTVTMLQWTGIPVYREGLEFVIPSGAWSVIEACSGLRYLIASATLGLLYAYLAYRSIWRRLAFIALSIIVPILANGLRAYMIVMIGHLSDMKLAVGVDHLLYGWVFFGVVMLLLFWIGSFWSESPTDAVTDGTTQQVWTTSRESSARSSYAAAISIVALIGLVAIASARMMSFERVLAEPLRAPDGENGWTRTPDFPWEQIPAAQPTQHQVKGTYRKGKSTVAFSLSLYPAQRQGSEAASAGNLIVHGEDYAFWTVVTRSRLLLGSDSAVSDVNSVSVKGTKPESSGKRPLLWQWYRMGTHVTASDYLAKLYSLWSFVVSQRTDGAYVLIGAPQGDTDEASDVLRQFVQDMAPAINRAIDRAVLGDTGN